jgi:uncharacterized protein YggE
MESRRAGSLLTVLVISLSVLGCGSDADDRSAADETPAAATEGVVAAAATGEADETVAEGQRSITVGGMGADYGPPDRSVVDIGVSALRPTVAEASSEATRAGASMLAALAEAGVPEAGIQTSQFSVNPYMDQYDYSRIVGYEVNVGYRVTVSEVADLGRVLAQAIEAGGDSVRAWSIGFEGDPDQHMEAARAAAWTDVRERAAATAEEVGEPLGELLDLHEKVLITSPQGMMQGGEGDAAAFDIPISPGVVGVIVLLTATYAIGT